MIPTVTAIRIAAALLLTGVANAAIAQTPVTPPPLPLMPMPASVVAGPGSLRIADGAQIVVPDSDAGAATAARILADRVKVDRGLMLTTGASGPIMFVRDPSITGDEAYALTVDAKGATIAAASDKGLLYGAMTLAQLLSPDAQFGKAVSIPAVVIRDAPRFAWRGLMVDVVRHFQPIQSLYPIVDALAAHKMNVLHLHLTDDQGWRVEIKRYPKLTEIGGFRTPASVGGPVPAKSGGFFTQVELKALVAYAGARGVTIVPEIDLPGHAQAAVAAYPEFGVLGDRPAVSHDWGVNPYLFAPTDASLGFIKAVLDELMAIFPSTFIHVGGDEAVKDQWERSPAVQAKMKSLGIKTENEMQSWMIDRLGDYLADHGRRLIGWDEILEGGLPASASVMSWRGEKGAIDAATLNHDVVMSPAPTLYVDSLQSARGDEPPGRLSIQTLADIYRYEPLPVGLDAAKARHILGAQINAWSEYLMGPAQIQHAVFPRLDALSEITWSPKAGRDFAGFVQRLQPQRLRYARQGIVAADSAFAVDYALQGTRGDTLRANRAKVAITTQTNYGTIRYTTDGTVPTLKSPAYAGPVSVKAGTTLRAAAFGADGAMTATARTFDTSRAGLLRRTSSDLVACPSGALGLRVPLTQDSTADAPAFNVNLFDTCFQYPAAPLDIATGFSVDVARLPRAYGLAHDFTKVKAHYNVTPYGELVIRAGGCTGTLVASYPLPDPATAPNQFSVKGDLPKQAGDTDLCLQFTAPIDQPFYAVAAMQLTERNR